MKTLQFAILIHAVAEIVSDARLALLKSLCETPPRLRPGV